MIEIYGRRSTVVKYGQPIYEQIVSIGERTWFFDPGYRSICQPVFHPTHTSTYMRGQQFEPIREKDILFAQKSEENLNGACNMYDGIQLDVHSAYFQLDLPCMRVCERARCCAYTTINCIQFVFFHFSFFIFSFLVNSHGSSFLKHKYVIAYKLY